MTEATAKIEDFGRCIDRKITNFREAKIDEIAHKVRDFVNFREAKIGAILRMQNRRSAKTVSLSVAFWRFCECKIAAPMAVSLHFSAEGRKVGDFWQKIAETPRETAEKR